VREVRQNCAGERRHFTDEDRARQRLRKVLESAGFRVVNRHSCIAPRRGDIAVIQPLLDEIHGHMAMYDGEIWISDFKQRSMYPGPEYRRQQPDFAIYRKRD
jgi:hypothetical protein